MHNDQIAKIAVSSHQDTLLDFGGLEQRGVAGSGHPQLRGGHHIMAQVTQKLDRVCSCTIARSVNLAVYRASHAVTSICVLLIPPIIRFTRASHDAR
jgi:hypothetical protein